MSHYVRQGSHITACTRWANFRSVGLALLMVCAATQALAGSASWLANPANGNWSNTSNWSSATVPNSSSDVATFGTSSVRSLSLTNYIQVRSIVFNAGASAYTVTASSPYNLNFTGVGVTNSSSVIQNFVAPVDGAGGSGGLFFSSGTTAGIQTVFTANGATLSGFSGGIILFNNNDLTGAASSAGGGTFTVNGGAGNGASGGYIGFNGKSKAGDSNVVYGTFTAYGGAVSGANGGGIGFQDTATAGYGHFTVNGGNVLGAGGANMNFNYGQAGGTASADHGNFVINGGSVDASTAPGGYNAGSVGFFGTSSAGSGTFYVNPSNAAGGNGGNLNFNDTSTAGAGSFTVNSNTVAGGDNGWLYFNNSATAGTGAFTVNGGSLSSTGGSTSFNDTTTAGNGTFTLNAGTVSGAYGGTVSFSNGTTSGTASAGSGTFNLNGSGVSSANGGEVDFYGASSASSGHFTVSGGSTVSGAKGGYLSFNNSSKAGDSNAVSGSFTINGGTFSGSNGGFLEFYDTASASYGQFIVNGVTVDGAGNGGINFYNSANAGSATFTMNATTAAGTNGGGSEMNFNDNASAGGAHFIVNAGAYGTNGNPNAHANGLISFNGNSTAGDSSTVFGTFTVNGGTAANSDGGEMHFQGSSNAAYGVFTTNAGTVSGAGWGSVNFAETSSAGNSTLTNNGSALVGTQLGVAGVTFFQDTATAGNSTLIANGGTSGGSGAAIAFSAGSTGGTSTVKVYGNGRLDISLHNAGSVAVGSVEGSGNIFLGGNNLTAGGNNVSTTFSGVMQDDGVNFIINGTHTTGGSFTKTGSGTTTLAGTNTYTGSTTVSTGRLDVTGGINSSAALTVASGATLGGTGSILSSSTINGTVAPGTTSTGTLTFSSALALAATSHIAWKLATNTTTGDKVAGAGVTATAGSVIDLNFTSSGSTVNFLDPFWTTARTIPILTATSLTGTFSLGTIGSDSGGRNPAWIGAFSLQQTATAVNLVWTPKSAWTGTPWQQWQITNFGANWNGASAAQTANPAADGIPNLLKYAMLLNSASRASTALSATKNTSTFDTVYTFNKAATDVTCTIEWSDTLVAGSWSTTGVSAPTILSDNGTTQQIKVSVPAGTGVTRRFVRLQVTQP